MTLWPLVIGRLGGDAGPESCSGDPGDEGDGEDGGDGEGDWGPNSLGGDNTGDGVLWALLLFCLCRGGGGVGDSRDLGVGEIGVGVGDLEIFSRDGERDSSLASGEVEGRPPICRDGGYSGVFGESEGRPPKGRDGGYSGVGDLEISSSEGDLDLLLPLLKCSFADGDILPGLILDG